MEREEHWQSEDVSGKKEKHSRRKKALSQRGHEGLMRGSPIYPFCQTPEWKGQCNWLLTDKPHKPYKRMKKLLEGQVKKSTLNSALVLLSSMTHLLISCPDLCPRAHGSPAAVPQGSAATCSGSSDPSVSFPTCLAWTMLSASSSYLALECICLVTGVCSDSWTMLPGSRPTSKELARSTAQRVLCPPKPPQRSSFSPPLATHPKPRPPSSSAFSRCE